MRKKLVSIVTVIALTVCTTLSGTDVLRVQAKETTKDEAVSVKTDAAGNAYRVTVENVLHAPSAHAQIRDVSVLKDIRNKNGDEEFTVDGSGNIVWENHGADIVYEGDADAGELPVGVKVSYFLNGRRMAPEDMAGQSGRVRIRFDYENRTRGDDYVPFVFLSAALLDTDVFTNINVENGSVSRLDDYMIAAGIAVPGLKEALKLSGCEKTEDIDIPEYLEVEADAEDFALEFTATMVTNGLFRDVETDGLDDIDEMLENMDELTDATEELADGMYKMLDGATELSDGLTEYTDAAEELADGAQELADGMRLLKDNAGALCDGANAIAVALHAMNEGLKKVDLSALSSMDETKMKAVADAVVLLKNSGEALGAALAALQTQLGSLDMDAMQQEGNEIAAQMGEIQTRLIELNQLLIQLDAQVTNADAQVTELENLITLLENKQTTSGINYADEIADARDIQAQIASIRDSAGTTRDNIRATTNAIAAAFASLSTSYASFAGRLSALAGMDTSDITRALSGLQSGMQTLAPFMEQMGGMGDMLKELTSSMEELTSGVSMLEKGAYQLSLGVSAYTKGAWQAADGAKELADGAREFADAGDELKDGYNKLHDGIKSAYDGALTFRDETKEAMEDMDNDALRDVFDALRRVKRADAEYTTFSGAPEGYKTSVRFLFETDAERSKEIVS